MNVALPQVNLEPSERLGLSVIRWDDESLVLSVSLLTEPAPTRSMADLIDIGLGIQPAFGRVVMGDLDVLVDAQGRIVSMEIRTNPATWSDEAISSLLEPLPPVSIRFSVAFDENEIARYDLSVRISRDRANRIVRLRLSDGTPTRWARLANDVIVGITTQGHLGEVRLLDFTVPSS